MVVEIFNLSQKIKIIKQYWKIITITIIITIKPHIVCPTCLRIVNRYIWRVGNLTGGPRRKDEVSYTKSRKIIHAVRWLPLRVPATRLRNLSRERNQNFYNQKFYKKLFFLQVFSFWEIKRKSEGARRLLG